MMIGWCTLFVKHQTRVHTFNSSDIKSILFHHIVTLLVGKYLYGSSRINTQISGFFIKKIDEYTSMSLNLRWIGST